MIERERERESQGEGGREKQGEAFSIICKDTLVEICQKICIHKCHYMSSAEFVQNEIVSRNFIIDVKNLRKRNFLAT